MIGFTDECANALGSIKFMARDRQQGDAPILKINGDFTDSLGCVAEERDRVAFGDRRLAWSRTVRE